jgi:hypothetical protein
MAPTLVEFFQPFKNARRQDQVLAVMYYLQEWEEFDVFTVGEIRAGLIRAKARGAKQANIAQVLSTADPCVEVQGKVAGKAVYELTNTGLEHVFELSGEKTEFQEVHDVYTVRDVAKTVADETVRGYIDEAIQCLGADAVRAAVVFLWSGAIATIREEAWKHGASAIDAALKTHNPKSRDFMRKGDFENVKDSALLEITVDLGIYDKSEKRVLGHALDLRNSCGHPVKYKPGVNKVSSFIEDVVGIVFA